MVDIAYREKGKGGNIKNAERGNIKKLTQLIRCFGADSPLRTARGNGWSLLYGRSRVG